MSGDIRAAGSLVNMLVQWRVPGEARSQTQKERATERYVALRMDDRASEMGGMTQTVAASTRLTSLSSLDRPEAGGHSLLLTCDY